LKLEISYLFEFVDFYPSVVNHRSGFEIDLY